MDDDLILEADAVDVDDDLIAEAVEAMEADLGSDDPDDLDVTLAEFGL